MRAHILVYAEVLFRWQMFATRIELLKAVDKPDIKMKKDEQQHRVGVLRICVRPDCRAPLDAHAHTCSTCGTPAQRPECTVCRLPVKGELTLLRVHASSGHQLIVLLVLLLGSLGLSRSCLRCYHVTHVSCWNNLSIPICPTGCGCYCTASTDGNLTRPSTRLGLSPPTNALMLEAAQAPRWGA